MKTHVLKLKNGSVIHFAGEPSESLRGLHMEFYEGQIPYTEQEAASLLWELIEETARKSLADEMAWREKYWSLTSGPGER